MNIAIGSDHRGLALKKQVSDILTGMGHDVRDFGAYGAESFDYPDVAIPMAQAVAGDEFKRGVLICGTGIGMSISANKVNGIRAALCSDVFAAKRARQHNDANILCLGAEREQPVREIVEAFLNTEFEGGRHQRRLDKIRNIEM